MNSVYELGGKPFTISALAGAVSEISGKKLTYLDMPVPDYAKMLAESMAEVLADSDLGILRGDPFTKSQDLVELIGHPTTSVFEALKQTLSK